ncbi:hypothetical protein [Helicobacter sp. 11S02596-1]|uniref:hypothetical protein n=1 Tax=Helicobacter sp. 11S02596-1 TaxID=1476194 RepID=UPI0015DFD604|nr:hypothetical protein [Helicobacter sp. 11S02596-1]
MRKYQVSQISQVAILSEKPRALLMESMPLKHPQITFAPPPSKNQQNFSASKRIS